MFQKIFAVYLGSQLEKGFTGFISEENFFLILVVEEGLTREKGQQFLGKLKKEIAAKEIDNLADFEGCIDEKIKEENLPAVFSLSAGFLKENILYLKTAGQGEVYIYREGNLVPIIKENLSASGYIKFDDLVVFTSASFIKAVSGEKELARFFNKKAPSEIVDQLTPTLKGKEDEGIIALFVQFKKREEELVVVPSVFDKLSDLYKQALIFSRKAGKKKTFTFLAVVFIFLILVWSVGLGYQRRKEAAIEKKIQTAKSVVAQKLEEAEEVSFFSPSQSQSLINQAKEEVAKLKKEVGERKEVEEINKIIKEAENKVFKKEEKEGEEFFDLTVDNKQAKGERMYLDDNSVAILDRQGGVIYLLSLSKKSLEKKKFNEIKKAQLVSLYQDEIAFYVPTEGLYKIDSQWKLKRVIEKDKEWGNIVDFWIYNRNLYLLDEGKSEIYKYLVAEEGYSSKTSYFKGGSFGLKGANSLAIDASVYVGFADHIFKFTAGSQEEFKASFPEPFLNLTKIFTNKDLEKLYAWEKRKGVIYILGKNGRYERQVSANIFKKASDFVVYQNSAYMLLGAKIYKVSLN